MKLLHISTAIFLAALTLQPAHSAVRKHILDIPIITQDGHFKGHTVSELCGVTCAEMILKHYGIRDVANVDIAEKFCSELYPAYNARMKYDEKDKIFFSTNCEASLSTGARFPGTNTHVLQIFFDSLGFQTDRQRSGYDVKSGRVPVKRFDLLMSHVRKLRPVIIHVENHYMLIVGFNDEKGLLHVIDPSDREVLNVNYIEFMNRKSRWRRTKPDRLGWDGRFLAVWK